jgi:hypothetical protein
MVLQNRVLQTEFAGQKALCMTLRKEGKSKARKGREGKKGKEGREKRKGKKARKRGEEKRKE